MDLGSSSFHLLHARTWPDGTIVDINSQREAVHLADGVARSGVIERGAWRRGLAAVEQLKSTVDLWGVSRTVAVATGVVRDSANGADFVADLERRHGIEVEVLSRDSEAALAYRGARSEFSSRPGNFCVIDLGGGSMEIAIGEQQASLWSCSLPLGVLRLRDLFEAGARPEPASDGEAVLARLRTALAGMGRVVRGFALEWLVLASGTARAVRDLVGTSGVGFPSQRLLSAASIRETRARIWHASNAELLALGVKSDRVSTIRYGLLALEAVLAELDQPEAWVSQRGLREGVALREFGAMAGRLRTTRRPVATAERSLPR